jgi:hypothetical protein
VILNIDQQGSTEHSARQKEPFKADSLSFFSIFPVSSHQLVAGFLKVENLVQRELRFRTATPLGQVGQDKFFKLL